MVMAETATAFRQYYVIAQKVLLLLLLELSICAACDRLRFVEITKLSICEAEIILSSLYCDRQYYLGNCLLACLRQAAHAGRTF